MVKCERALDDPDRLARTGEVVDGDHVEAAGSLEAAGPGQIVEGHGADAATLPAWDRLGRLAETAPAPTAPLPTFKSRALVDLADREALYQAMEGR